VVFLLDTIGYSFTVNELGIVSLKEMDYIEAEGLIFDNGLL